MSPKAKIYLSIASILMIAVIATVVVVAVFAASEQSFTSNVNVSYKAVQVHGSARANVRFGDIISPMKTDSAEEEIVFNPEDETSTKSLTPTQDIITLTDVENQNFVVFEYIFTNDDSKPFAAILTYSDTGSTDTGISVFTAAGEALQTPGLDNVNTPVSDMSGTVVSASVPGAVDGTKGSLYVYVLFKLDDGVDEAGFSGTFTWTLSVAG